MLMDDTKYVVSPRYGTKSPRENLEMGIQEAIMRLLAYILFPIKIRMCFHGEKNDLFFYP